MKKLISGKGMIIFLKVMTVGIMTIFFLSYPFTAENTKAYFFDKTTDNLTIQVIGQPLPVPEEVSPEVSGVPISLEGKPTDPDKNPKTKTSEKSVINNQDILSVENVSENNLPENDYTCSENQENPAEGGIFDHGKNPLIDNSNYSGHGEINSEAGVHQEGSLTKDIQQDVKVESE